MPKILGLRPSTASKRLIAVAACTTALLTLYLLTQDTHAWLLPGVFRAREQCPPDAWAAGAWVPRADTPTPTAPEPEPESESEPAEGANATATAPDALALAGFRGCASDREVRWHLGVDTPGQWARFPAVSGWRWAPGRACGGLRALDGAALARDLVERGGWLLLGDSITEGHFFSMSCMLYPHVRATPNYTENPYFDRAWPQHLYLTPDSPLVPTLRLPAGFNISTTPLVTFRRIDLLLSKPELETLHAAHFPPPAGSGAPLFSDEAVWTLAPAEYMPLFVGGHYRTLVAATGGHWTTTLFGGLADAPGEPPGAGIARVLALFRTAMRAWAARVQAALDEAAVMVPAGADALPRRAVVVRAYLPGHEDCHAQRAPWAAVRPFEFNWYNWAQIGDFNRVFEEVVAAPAVRDIHFLPIDRPALLRPDAHATGDCLHILAGPGVMEGWTHYIWQFVTRELPARMR